MENDDDVGVLIAGILAKTSGSAAIPVAQLDTCIEKLSLQMNTLKARVFDTINREYRDFFAVSGDSIDTGADLAAFSGHAKRIDSFIASVAEQENLKKRLESTRRTNALLAVLQSVHMGLREVDRALTTGAITTAAAHLHTVAANMGAVDTVTSDGCDPKVYTALRAELRRARSAMKSNLEDLWRTAVVWGDNASRAPLGNVLRVTSTVSLGSPSASQVDLCDIVISTHTLGLLPERMVHVAKSMQRLFLGPLVAAAGSALTVVVTSSGGVRSLTLEVASSATASKAAPKAKAGIRRRLAPGPAISDMLSSCYAVFAFVATHLIGNEAPGDSAVPDAATAAATLIGAHVWVSWTTDVCSQALANPLTAPDAQPEDHHQILDAVIGFEASIARMGFTATAPTALSDYVRDAALLTANRRRQQLVLAARDLLVQADNNTVEVTHATTRGGLFGDLVAPDDVRVADSVFTFPTCRVSAATHAFVDLTYTTLAEMTAAPPAVAAQLFFGARDMWDLFRALLPTRLPKTGSSTQAGALFYNDCAFLAHHALSLGHQHKPHLAPELHPVATFVDMVPLFQKLGEEQLAHVVATEQAALLHFAPAIMQPESSPSPVASVATVPTATQALAHLTTIQTALQGVLPATIYAASLGSMLAAFLTTLADAVLHKEDIAQVDAEALHVQLNTLMQRIPRYFDHKVYPDFSVHVAGWRRFTQIVMFLDLGLEDILSCWRAGQVVLTADELRRLVRALFANSDLRARCLAEIIA